MEGLILTAARPGVLLWGTLSWGTALMALTTGAIPLGLALRDRLRNPRRTTAACLGAMPGGTTLRPRVA